MDLQLQIFLNKLKQGFELEALEILEHILASYGTDAFF
ncbi:hypothetical protein LEWO105114_06075 [Legionella worsleiensis]|nr:Uncharacterised protein [Legionella worsleiensis]